MRKLQMSVLLSGQLPEPESRLKSFAASWVVQIALVMFLLTLKFAAPVVIEHISEDHSLTWVAPPEPVTEAPPVITPPVTHLQPPTPKVLAVLPRPKIVVPDPPVVPEVKLAMERPLPVIPVKPVAVKPIPQVGKFEETQIASKSAAPHAPAITTGGFGDPQGIHGVQKAEPRVVAASFGSFESPTGSGSGARVKSSRTVEGSNFGDATPGTGRTTGSSRHAVQNGGFGDAQNVQSSATVRKTAAATSTPVEIQFKPTPIYSDEARKLRLEGEVLVDVFFPATGKPRVLRLVRGLGHGLDEAAAHCAESIRYRPARTAAGDAVDSVAMLHVVFQIAN